MMHHFGDPCRHCGVAHDDVAPGPCLGDPKKAIPIAFCGLGVRWDNVEHFRIRFSDGHVEDRWEHVSMQSPYYHFGYSADLRHPPAHDETLRRTAQ